MAIVMSINGIVPKLTSAKREIIRVTRMRHAQTRPARMRANAKVDFQEAVENVCLYVIRIVSMVATALSPMCAIAAAATWACHARKI